MNARGVIERLGRTTPAQVEALALLQRLYAGQGPPTIEAMLEQAPAVEAALLQAERIETSSERIVRGCLKLKPTPASSPPAGF